MSLYEIFDRYEGEGTLPSRKETIARLMRGRMDLVIIGGGFVGATAARMAALNGLQVALLESGDFGTQASNRVLLAPSTVRIRIAKDHTKFRYVDEVLLVQDTILSARQEGALCLNYAEVLVSHHDSRNEDVAISWKDALTGLRYELTAGSVLNCAGVAVALVGRVSPAQFSSAVGIEHQVSIVAREPCHQLINVRTREHEVVICPHPAGVVFRLTATSKEALEKGIPLPHEYNTQLICDVSYGMRALAYDRRQRPQRAPISDYRSGVASLWGGDYGFVESAIERELSKLVHRGGNRISLQPLGPRPLPRDAGERQAALEEFLIRCREHGVREDIASDTAARLGGRVRRLLGQERAFEYVGNAALRGEIALCCQESMVCTIHDLIERRLRQISLNAQRPINLDEVHTCGVEHGLVDTNLTSYKERVAVKAERLERVQSERRLRLWPND